VSCDEDRGDSQEKVARNSLAEMVSLFTYKSHLVGATNQRMPLRCENVRTNKQGAVKTTHQLSNQDVMDSEYSGSKHFENSALFCTLSLWYQKWYQNLRS